jgi:hypothetical protein
VQVHVGPIPSRDAVEFIRYARGVLAERSSTEAPEHTRVTPEVLQGFLGFLDEWESIAERSSTFLWETDVDAEQIEFLALALFKIASSLDTPAPGANDGPQPGALFYRSFVNAFLDALSAENRSLAAYAEELRSSWPGLDGD